MKDIPAALLAHLQGETANTALVWRIDKSDGTFIRGTEHDRDITLGADESPTPEYAGTYPARSNISGTQLRSTGDMSVDNMEIEGALDSDAQTVDVSIGDIEAGLFDRAQVWIWLCNWAAPEDGAYVVKRGFLGDIRRDSDGKYSTEIRGLTQLLQQTFVRTYSERCQVKNFGDAECQVDVPALTETGIVTAVANRRRFDASLTGGNPAGFFSLGLVRFTTGANTGYTRELTRDDYADVIGQLLFWDAFPFDVAPGDAFEIEPGCDRLRGTCKDKYSNLLNFRGYGICIEGLDALMRGPT